MSKKTKKTVQQPKKKKNANPLGAPKRPGGSNLKESKFMAPASFGSSIVTGAPKFNGGNGFVVRHTEYLDDMLSTQVFTIDPDNVYDLNPGLADTFPWLGTVAAGFEQYRWKKLRFVYRSRAATNQTGTVYLATQLDSQDADFSSKQEMMAYAGAQNNNVWINTEHNCLMQRGDYMKKYFIRTGPLVSGQDSQLYDTGKFTWAITSSAGSGTFMGELFVDYEVELFNPKMNIASVGVNYQAEFNDAKSFLFSGSAVEDGIWMPNDDYVTVSNDAVTLQQAGLYKVDLTAYDYNIPNAVTITAATEGPGVGIYDLTKMFLSTTGEAIWSAYVLITQAQTGINWAITAIDTWTTALSIIQVPLAAASLMTGGFTVLDAESLRIAQRRHPKLKFVIRSSVHAIPEGKQRKPALDERKVPVSDYRLSRPLEGRSILPAHPVVRDRRQVGSLHHSYDEEEPA